MPVLPESLSSCKMPVEPSAIGLSFPSFRYVLNVILWCVVRSNTAQLNCAGITVTAGIMAFTQAGGGLNLPLGTVGGTAGATLRVVSSGGALPVTVASVATITLLLGSGAGFINPFTP